MHLFEVTTPNGKLEYQFPASLSEITLGKLIQFQKSVESEKPQTLFEFEETKPSPEQVAAYITNQSAAERNEWFDYYVKQVSFWCDMPEDIARKISIQYIISLRNKIAETMDSFNYIDDLKEFYLPKPKGNKPGVKWIVSEKYMKGNALIDFVEAMQYEHIYESSLEELEESEKYRTYVRDMKNNRYDILPKLIALICRKEIDGKPQEFHDYIVEENEKKFYELPCDIALSIGFFLLKRKQKYTGYSLTSMKPLA